MSLNTWKCVALLALCVPASAQDIFDSVRQNSADSYCARVVDGEDQLLTSDRIRQDKALQVCNGQQLLDPAGTYDVVTYQRSRISVNLMAMNQAVPMPPMIEPQPPISGSCEILFGPWTHDSEPEGVAQPVDRVWNQSTQPGSPTNGTTWEITSENPMIPGKKYFRTTLNKNNDGHKRTERRLNWEPPPSEAIKYGDDWEAEKTYIYALLFRADEAPSPRGFAMQWHAPNNVATGSASPHHGLRGRDGGFAVYMKDRENNADQKDYRNVYSQNIIDWPAMKGRTVAIAFKVRWSGRSRSEGSRGIFEVYLDGERVYEANGDRNVTYGVSESEGGVRFPYWKYGGYDVGSNTGLYQNSYTNMTVLSEGCSPADVLKAVDFKNAR